MAHNLEIVFTKQMPHVLFTTCIKVIQADHIITFLYQALTKMRADKASSTSY